MVCPHHRGLCAYDEPSDERCFFCHADWSKITAPATRIETRAGVSKDGEPIVVEEVHYLSGYGEMPLDHFWRHALTWQKSDADTARLAAKAAARKAASLPRESGAVALIQEEVAGTTVRQIAALIPIPEGAEPDYVYLIVRGVEAMTRRATLAGRILDGDPIIEGPVTDLPEGITAPGMDMYRVTSGTVAA